AVAAATQAGDAGPRHADAVDAFAVSAEAVDAEAVRADAFDAGGVSGRRCRLASHPRRGWTQARDTVIVLAAAKDAGAGVAIAPDAGAAFAGAPDASARARVRAPDAEAGRTRAVVDPAHAGRGVPGAG